MQPRIGSHVRSNLVAYVALFVALSGTAWAANGPLAARNTVGSAAIVNGQVKRADVAASAINSAKVANGTLGKADFASGTLLEGPPGPQGPPGPAGGSSSGAPSGPAGGDLTGTYPSPRIGANAIGPVEVIGDSLTSADLAPGSVGSSEVAFNSLTGDDVSESALAQVPSALLGGLGRSGSSGQNCDPEAATFVTCATVTLNLPTRTRVLVIGRITAYTETATGAKIGAGRCRLGTSVTGGLAGSETDLTTGERNVALSDNVGLLAVTPPLGPGQVSFGVDCNQNPNSGAVFYRHAGVAAVAISPS